MTEPLPLAPQLMAEWLPFWKAAGFFLGTFILEDVAAVGAGLLLASGEITWPAAFLACFLGIWLGDVGLYAIARQGGRNWFERSRFKRYSAKVERSEQWFARRGTLILIFSRLLPGARLPTYLAAGFLRVPLPRFLLVTGIASCVWTLVVLRLTELAGNRVLNWLESYRDGGLLLLGAAIAMIAAVQLARRWLFQLAWRRLWRLRHWEFWPAWMFYPPVAVYCLWLAIKFRGLSLPTAANPGIFSGGLVGESKHAILEELFTNFPRLTAEAKLIPQGSFSSRLRQLEGHIAEMKLEFPFILKPDFGQRGAGMKLICNLAQAEAYLCQTNAPLLLQRHAPGPLEAGIFYYRFPHQARGRIFAITEKIFPVIIGDGRSTVAELIMHDPRAHLIAEKYLERFQDRRDSVLEEGQQLRLVESGNHAQGCIFRDGMRLWSPQLEARVDEIAQRLPGFFIGRYDIRYASEDDLRAGANFQIIELNGAASEATNIYDSRNSLLSAYRTLFHQWHLVFAIGAANRKRGCAPTKIKLVWHAWREYSKLAATYPAAD